MDMRDLERIRFVTRYFNDLQGLRFSVPLGLIALGGGALASPFAGWRLAALLFLGACLLRLGAGRYYRTAFGEIVPMPIPQAADLYCISIVHRTGAVPWLHGFPLVSPGVRQFLSPLGTASGLFLFLLAIAPNIQAGSQTWPTLEGIGVFEPTMATVWKPIDYEAISAQAICLLGGSFFLGVCLRREGRSSSCYLGLGALLLALAALGASLGFLVGQDAEEIVRTINLFLPVVVHPWMALLVCGSSMVLTGLLDHWQLVRGLGRPASPDPT